MSTVGLVIPVLNNFDQAVEFIYSAKTKENELRIYIQPQYRYQVPLAKAWNRGFQEAVADGCEYVIIANDDIIFAPHTIDSAVREFDNYCGQRDIVYIFNEISPTFSDPFEIVFLDTEDEVISSEYEGDPLEPKNLFSCFMVKSSFQNLVGTFDENFDPAWWEDTDIRYRIHLLGYTMMYGKAPYVHLMHQTTKKLTIPINSLKSQQYYEKKWGSCRKDLKEAFKTPYNDPTINPKEWRHL